MPIVKETIRHKTGIMPIVQQTIHNKTGIMPTVNQIQTIKQGSMPIIHTLINKYIKHQVLQRIMCKLQHHYQHSHQETHVLLATAQARVCPKNGTPFNVKMLLDNGSQISFITASLANKLAFKPYTNNIQISGILNDCSEVSQSVSQ